jgi:arginase
MLQAKEYTVFQGRVADHNDFAVPGAKAIGAALASRSKLSPVFVGSPERVVLNGWQVELTAALPSLLQLQDRLDAVLTRDSISVAATSRCAASMATLPVLARHHPSACVIWFDAHGDLNTPASTTTGFLGGMSLSAALGLWQSGLGSGLDLDRVVLVGQRDLDAFEKNLIETHAIPHVLPGPGLARRLSQVIAGRPVYMHVDCDVLDPGIVPTDYVCEGGLTLADLRTCCDVIAQHTYLGLEIAEFQNVWEAGGDAVSPEPLLNALAPLL